MALKDRIPTPSDKTCLCELFYLGFGRDAELGKIARAADEHSRAHRLEQV